MSYNKQKDLPLKVGDVNTEELGKIFNKSIAKDFGIKTENNEVDLLDYATKSFLFYGASVVAGRALPDVRDGLKHGQRRTLFTMRNDLKLSHTGAFKKSARVVGSVIGLYHPHGDLAAYESLVNLSQSWKKNLPLADGQGNWGSIDGSPAAHQRYTEVRLTKASTLMFSDINENTVNFIPNYDGTEVEPEVLPVPYPNILINGAPAGSIGVGMASSLLPHNPTEVMNAMIMVLEHRRDGVETTIDDFINHIPGPDFPTGGLMYNTENIKDLYRTGVGSVRLRAKHHVEDLPRGRSEIVIDEIPWGTTKSSIIEGIVELRKKAEKEDRLAMSIVAVNDDSDKHGLRISIQIKAGADPEVVWNYICKNTKTDVSHASFSIVLNQIVNSKGKFASAPKAYGLLTILEKYIDFRESYFLRKHKNLIAGYDKRLHLIDGLLKAIDVIDDIIIVIKKSNNIESAKETLISDFGFSLEQATSIVALRLGRLTKMPREELLSEKSNFQKLRAYSLSILTDEVVKYNVLIEESKIVAKDIGHPRRTQIKPELSGIDLEDIIPKEDCVVYVTNKGYVKRISAKKIAKQNRGSQGKRGITLSDGDFVEKIFHTNTHSVIMFTMSSGQIYGTKAYNVPDSPRGSYIENIFEISDGEKIVNVLEVESFDSNNIILVTKNGMIKVSNLDLYKNCTRKPGVKGLKLKENDEVVSAKIEPIDSTKEVLISTKTANAIRFKLSDVRVIGRSGSGVRGIKLKDGNEVVGSIILTEDTTVATITKNGMVKLSDSKEFKIQGRGGLGTKCMDLTKKSGDLISVVSWERSSDFDLVTITKMGVLNRINTSEMKTTARRTKGFKLVDIRDNDTLCYVLKVAKDEIEESSTED